MVRGVSHTYDVCFVARSHSAEHRCFAPRAALFLVREGHLYAPLREDIRLRVRQCLRLYLKDAGPLDYPPFHGGHMSVENSIRSATVRPCIQDDRRLLAQLREHPCRCGIRRSASDVSDSLASTP